MGDGEDDECPMAAGDFLYSLGATGKKGICDAWNYEADRFGLLPP